MTNSALPAHLEVLLTDEPVLDVYAHAPWRVPDGLFDEIRARAEQLNNDPRTRQLTREIPDIFADHATAVCGHDGRDPRHGAPRDPRGQAEEYKRLAAEASEIVRTKEPGTIEYYTYLNADGTEAFVHERYRDSAAGLAHFENIRHLMPAFLDVATITGEVCGNPSPELREALEAAGVTIYTPL